MNYHKSKPAISHFRLSLLFLLVAVVMIPFTYAKADSDKTEIYTADDLMSIPDDASGS